MQNITTAFGGSAVQHKVHLQSYEKKEEAYPGLLKSTPGPGQTHISNKNPLNEYRHVHILCFHGMLTI